MPFNPKTRASSGFKKEEAVVRQPPLSNPCSVAGFTRTVKSAVIVNYAVVYDGGP